MKKSIILGAVIASFVLSACSLFKTYSAEAKEVDVYLIDNATSGAKSIEQCKLGTIEPMFINGERFIPYFTLEQYASLYDPYFEDDVKSSVETSGSTSTWTIYRGEQLYFYAIISSLTKSIMTAGSIYSAMKSDSNPSDYSLISKFTKFDDSYEILEDRTYAEYKFGSYGFKSFSKSGERFYPLGLLDNAFSETSNLFHFYNYQAIYATWDVENYSKDFKTNNGLGGSVSVDKQMEALVKNETIPEYLLDYNAACFLFVLDNFYGLKSYYKISSMKEYFSKYRFHDAMYSKDGEVRGNAYATALAMFDDHHTGLVSANNAWGEGKTKAIGGDNVIKRQYLNQKLSEERKKYIGSQVHTVTSDHQTGYFYFDSFDLGTTADVFNADGSIKDTAWMYDSYYNVLQNLKEFKEEGVKNIIIDVSTNGGGVIGVMAKILALISKDNRGIVSMYDESMGVVNTSVCSVDVNMDGKYTADETYGNVFDNIYIMASDCSFSCGNAFPCYAKEMGYKIIGEKSGGGECAVGIHYMPNSEYVYHSSMTHLGSYNAQTMKFTGFESGATPDISLVDQNKTSFAEYNGDNIVYNIPNGLYSIKKLADWIS